MERAARLCLLLGLLILVVPAALVPIPPLLDLPNHVARLHLLVDAVVAGREHPFFAVDWTHAMVNTPVDAFGVAIGAVIGAGAAESVLCALALVLPPLGAALLNRALFGGRHWWMAAFPMLDWNGSLLLGFISFQIGAGQRYWPRPGTMAWCGGGRPCRAWPPARWQPLGSCSCILLRRRSSRCCWAGSCSGVAWGDGAACRDVFPGCLPRGWHACCRCCSISR
ncbi:hypothetical protein [Roseomonas fluvialis]|uniref:Uncharacterized protein n=1 Tax=Roseomonas fluvialis TaxID=1750527 RepID=A0ABM7Y9N0_9PROT|nr:hypothetical protein [Roseomonas fluvialis]BDG74780.1 hypothetical protein Rmf_47090 [Roseomonas fluvialis]